MKHTYFLPLLLALIIPHNIYADTIELSNGKMIEGIFTGRDGDIIKFEVDGISMTFQAKDVKNIAMGSSAQPSAKEKKSKEKTATGSASIDTGTVLTIRLSEKLDSGQHATGYKFTAVLEGALSNSGVTVAPAGSQVYGVISEAVKARRLTGSAKILVTLTDIKINGQITPISTSAINALTDSSTKGTVSKVARGAAIGALADGSDGAKTGAKVGLGIAILRGGNQVVIPAGTLLDFKLSAPLKTKS